MAYSFVQYLGDGATTVFAVPFEYLDKSHVTVKVLGIPTAFTWLGPSVVKIQPAPQGLVEIRRSTPKDNPPVDFSDGAVLKEKDLDLLALFSLYCAQESQDSSDQAIAQSSLGIDLAKVYQGTLAINPTVRPNGQPLQVGDLYFNSGAKTMRVYTGLLWQDIGITVPGILKKPDTPVIATAGQTSVPVPGGFDPSGIVAFVNGIQVNPPEVSFTSGTTLVFTEAFTGGEEITWLAFGVFQVAGTVSRAELSMSSGASLMGFQPAGTGAVAVTVESVLKDLPVSVKWFGAKGDGVTDDTNAIQAALDYVGSTGGGRVVLPKTSVGYRITRTLRYWSFTTIEGVTPARYPFADITKASALIPDFSDPNQWVLEPKTTLGGAPVAYNTLLTGLPDGPTYNCAVRNLFISAKNTIPYGGIRMHGCPGAVVENVSILGTGTGLLVNETFGGYFNVHTQTAYYGTIAWGESNANVYDVYSTQAAPKAKTVPTAYLFPGLSALNGSLTGLGFSTNAHYNRPFGMILGAPLGATASNNEVGVTSEYFDGGVFMVGAKSAVFNRLYVEGAANEVSFAIVAAYSSFVANATHAYLSGTGTLVDLGGTLSGDIALTGVISYANFGAGPSIDNFSTFTVRGVQMSGVALSSPRPNVYFPSDVGAWQGPILQNAWVNAGGANAQIAYRLNHRTGRVEMKGVPISGTENQAIFILPVGYRPSERRSFPVVVTGAAAAFGAVIVLATGEVIPATTGMSANGLDLSPITFKAEQ